MTISAKIIADSISDAGIRITTMELEYPRFIHSEFMTHRVFSRNAASSRAIPVEKARARLMDDPAMPIRWGANQGGMQAKMEDIEDRSFAKTLWFLARDFAVKMADLLAGLGLHKQWCNRLTEPFTHIKVVVTSTEWDNFFALRLHPDAQPEIMELARVMKEAMDLSDPIHLNPGDWHVPYYKNGQWRASGYFEIGQFTMDELDDKRGGARLSDALAISASCCAQVSYRLLDDTLKKAQKIYQRLIVAEPMHASPFEHQASPMKAPNERAVIRDGSKDQYLGATHTDHKNGDFWSANFRGWTQYRQIL